MSRHIAGFRTAQYTPERVLRDKGLSGRASVVDLARAAGPFDQTNPGYLSEKELRAGADQLLAGGGFDTNDRVDGYRFSGRAMGRVQAAVPRPNSTRRFSATEIRQAAAGWDDGNRYLNEKELTAGALELQMRASRGGAITAADVAAIRSWTGVSSAGPAVNAPNGPELLEDLNASEARVALARVAPGVSFDRLASDADEIIDNREGTRTSPFYTSIEAREDGVVEVSLHTNFDYEGSEFSHYTSFEINGNDVSIVDAGT